MRRLLCAIAVLAVACGEPDPEVSCRDDGTCEVGGPCELDADCSTGLCDGTCREPCSDDDECGTGFGCRVLSGAAATACVEVAPAAGDLGDSCVDAQTCRGGVCDAGRCGELCTTCPPGALCGPAVVEGLSVGVCRWAPAAATTTLGPIAVGPAGSEPVDIEVGPEFVAFALVVRDAAPGGARRVGVGSLVSPRGIVLDDGDRASVDLNPASIPYPDVATVFVPISDTGATEAGTYRVSARLWDIDFELPDPFVPASGEVYVDVVPEYVGEEGGLVDLNVFVTPGAGVTPSLGDVYLRAVLDVVEQQFAGAGVALGAITPASVPADFDTVSGSDAVREICRSQSASGTWGTAVNVIVVDRLEFALGFTGTSPSPPGLHGVAPACVVVDAAGDPLETGIVAAHELGHFLGLDHTTAYNADGSVFGVDPISDTPSCDADRTDCPDRANLMYPVIDFGVEHALTAGQLRVVSRSPVLYEMVRADACAGWPARDVTSTRKAAGFVPTRGSTTGTCGGSGGEVAHLLRLFEPTTVRLSSAGATIYVRANDCAVGEELACGVDEVEVALASGDYFVFVDREEPGPYVLEL